MKIRKNHHKKNYRYNTNRKNLQKKHLNTGKIKDVTVKKVWEDYKTPMRNLSEMGLAADPNKVIGLPNYKQSRLKTVKIVNGFVEEEINADDLKTNKYPAQQKQHIADLLEEQSKERADPAFRLPKGVVKELTYFLDKYKFNYKAMVSDRRNHGQWTWRQFRAKINRFMAIPEQFNEYLTKKGMNPGQKPNWEEYDSDGELN